MKVLVDLPDELYDTLRSKTLYLTSGARSNGKHLVCELIGCVLNGVVIKDIQIGDNVYHADDLTMVQGTSTDDIYACPLSKCKYEAETVRNCEVCKHHVLDKRTQKHACKKWKCEFERQ